MEVSASAAGKASQAESPTPEPQPPAEAKPPSASLPLDPFDPETPLGEPGVDLWKGATCYWVRNEQGGPKGATCRGFLLWVGTQGGRSLGPSWSINFENVLFRKKSICIRDETTQCVHSLVFRLYFVSVFDD